MKGSRTKLELVVFGITSDRVLPLCEQAQAVFDSHPSPAWLSPPMKQMSEWLCRARKEDSVDALLKAARCAEAVLRNEPDVDLGQG